MEYDTQSALAENNFYKTSDELYKSSSEVWMKIKLEQSFSQLLGIFKLWSQQNVGLMRCMYQLISIFYGEIHLLLIILYSELYSREIQNVLWTVQIMESIEIVPNISKNLSTGCNPIKTSKHIFNFFRSSHLTFHMQMSACECFTFACHDDSAECLALMASHV